jgi:hypothetical protein
MNFKTKNITPFLVIIYFLTATGIALNTQIHTDEYWSYASIFYTTKGYLPLKDFFSHRLPFFSLFYAYLIGLIDISLLNARMLSVLLATFVLYKLLQEVKKSENNIYVLIVIFLAYIHPTNLYLLSTVTTYALTNAIILLSLKSYDGKNFYQYILINKLVYLMRYIIDIFPLIEVVNLFLLKRGWKYIIFSLASTITIIVCLFIVYGNNAYLDTFIFNKQSFEFMLSSGAISNDVSKITKFIYLRKEEIKYWFAIYVILFVTIYYTKLIERSLKSISHYLVYLVFIYLFYYLTLNDYPITKITALPIILYAYGRASKSIPSAIHKIIICIVIIPLIIFKMPLIENEGKKSLAICSYIDCSKRTLAINPILQTMTSTINTKLIMELYSFAQNDSNYGLYKGVDIIKSIENMEYQNIVLDERFVNRKNMSKMISDIEFEEIFKQINKNYNLKETYFDSALGMKVYAYTIK